jgi:PST family polysaccharide transporter
LYSNVETPESVEISAAATVSAPAPSDPAMVRAIAWTGASKWATQLLTWTSTIFVARILSPSDYGLFGMATVYLGMVALISEFGLGQAVVVLREMSREHIAQINTLSAAFGGLLFVVSCALARPLGHFFHTSKLPPVIVVMSLSFLISGAQVVPDALLQRGLRFKLLAGFDTVRTFAQAPVTILLAWLGFGYWSLALSSVSGVVVYSTLVILAQPCAFAWPRWREIRGALRFSSDVLGSRVAWYAYSNSDFMVAGRMLGQSALGAYEMAWTIASAPVDKVTSLVTRVTPAFFSAVQHDKSELRRYLLRITEGLSLITFPASVGIALLADQFVICVLGPKWLASATPLRLLGLYAGFRSITTLFPGILYATRQSRFVMWNTVVAAMVFPAAFYFTSRWGTTGIAITWILLYPLITAPFMWRTFIEIELPVGTYLKSLLPALRACLVMTGMVLAVRLALPSTLPLAMRFALSVMTGILAYATILALIDRQRLRSFYAVIRSARSGSK